MPLASASEIRRMFYTRDVVRATLDAVHGDVIDFGAGMSRYKKWILEKGKTYTAMDIQAFPGVDVVGDACNPPLPDASFDTALSTHVLEHVQEPWKMVEHMARVLRPGGTAVIMVPFVYPFHADPTDFFRFSEQGLRSLFERAGMRVELCAKYGGMFSLFNEVMKQKYFSPYKRPHPWWKRRLNSAIECTCAFLNRFFPPDIAYVNLVCVAHKPV